MRLHRARAWIPAHGPALLLLLLGPAAAASPPFVDLHLQGITTSNDEYGIWLYWSPRSYLVKLPGRRPLQAPAPHDWFASIALQCRADGRPQFTGPSPIRALLRVELHPDQRDVWNVWHPMYWLLGLAGYEHDRTTARVRLNGGPARRSEFIRPRIDYSFARPNQELELEPRGPLKALAAGEELTLWVRGLDLRIDAVFDGTRPSPTGDPAAIRRAAALMLKHCVPPEADAK